MKRSTKLLVIGVVLLVLGCGVTFLQYLNFTSADRQGPDGPELLPLAVLDFAMSICGYLGAALTAVAIGLKVAAGGDARAVLPDLDDELDDEIALGRGPA
ncbi:Hypothetical protein PFR_JS12-1_2058 [Propionibacterium freudenreichii]|uniref:hypothetical protein n=1 Tax=Propionibacterium freudenreichii TaxID=1744 RepID=UPI000BC31ECD|nr:hypothetical protein [Propionibacterium freudenreichii]SBN96441.1 Hypothetical protein PFR_JS12-2_2057 [Propionibacterium freudenreichii]SCC98026.1 Hypothetical protein PFR_JS12-1_2058 [Propionibacterium freudenreichii]